MIEAPMNNECGLCFAADETPVTVFLSVTGVEIGAAWAASLGDAPNGVFQLQNTTGCEWSTLIDGWTYFLGLLPGVSAISITKPLVPDKFLAIITGACVLHYPNSITNPNSAFFSGQATISWTDPGSDTSISRVAESINIAREPDTFAEFFPVEENVNVYRFAKKKDSTNVKIKFDYS